MPTLSGKMPIEGDYKEIGSMLLKHANKGRAWAQVYVGNKYFNGVNSFALDKEKRLQSIKQAADQRDPDGLFEMALTCKEGTLERNESRYMYYLKEAAILGQPDAQEELATTYNRRNNEQEQILHYATLAASHGNSRACGMLGHFFMRAECDLTESLILGKHYSEMYFEDGRRRPLQPSIRIQLIVSIVSSWLGSV